MGCIGYRAIDQDDFGVEQNSGLLHDSFPADRRPDLPDAMNQVRTYRSVAR